MNDQKVLVVGGPGSSGSSTIAKRLAKYFNIERVYGGGFFRKEAQSRGYDSLEAFYREVKESVLKEIDVKVDENFRALAKKGGVLIESKIFAAIATKENIPCNAKVWITASLEVRVNRVLGKENISNPVQSFLRKKQIRKDLEKRWELDRRRYKELYGVDYTAQDRYNDLVVDSSEQNEDETFDLIVGFLEKKGIVCDR
ncbi:(d)CMP kinase [bacterium]|nr:(d)CMP kinase [bacterium]